MVAVLMVTVPVLFERGLRTSVPNMLGLSIAALSIILHFMQTTLNVDDWSWRQLSGVN